MKTLEKAAQKLVAKKVPKKPKPKPEEICFVIMPFGGWFDGYYENIYMEAIKTAGFVPRRADDLYRASNIVQDIWDLTKKAKIIVADLTNKNPNVFYELGLAHALAKPVILISETISDIPFDLRSLRIIEYNKNEPQWGKVLQEKLKRAIEETIQSPNETIPSAFLETKRSDLAIPKVTVHEKEIIELKQEVEWIKNQLSRNSIGNETSIFKTIEWKEDPVIFAHQMHYSGMSRSDIIERIRIKFAYSTRQAISIVDRALGSK